MQFLSGCISQHKLDFNMPSRPKQKQRHVTGFQLWAYLNQFIPDKVKPKTFQHKLQLFWNDKAAKYLLVILD